MCGGNHKVSHTSEAVSTQNAQAPSTPQQLLLMQSRDAVQNRTTQQQQSPPTGGSAVARARRGLIRICCCCCCAWWWWWHMGRSSCAVQHSEGHCTEQCEVGPCIQCATRTSWKEGKGASVEACEGSVRRCLVPAMDGSGQLTRRHTQVGEEAHPQCTSS